MGRGSLVAKWYPREWGRELKLEIALMLSESCASLAARGETSNGLRVEKLVSCALTGDDC